MASKQDTERKDCKGCEFLEVWLSPEDPPFFRCKKLNYPITPKQGEMPCEVGVQTKLRF